MNQPINMDSLKSANEITILPMELSNVLVDKELFQEVNDSKKLDEKSLKLQERQSKSTLKMMKNDVAMRQANVKRALSLEKANSVLSEPACDSDFYRLVYECRNNPYGYTPVQYAVAMGNVDVLKYLIESGENVNGLTPPIPIYDNALNLLGYKNGFSALMMALGNIEMVELLLANGADADITFNNIINDNNINYKEGPYKIKIEGYTNDGYIMKGKISLLEIAKAFVKKGIIDPKVFDLIKNAIQK